MLDQCNLVTYYSKLLLILFLPPVFNSYSVKFYKKILCYWCYANAVSKAGFSTLIYFFNFFLFFSKNFCLNDLCFIKRLKTDNVWRHLRLIIYEKQTEKERGRKKQKSRPDEEIWSCLTLPQPLVPWPTRMTTGNFVVGSFNRIV